MYTMYTMYKVLDRTGWRCATVRLSALRVSCIGGAVWGWLIGWEGG